MVLMGQMEMEAGGDVMVPMAVSPEAYAPLLAVVTVEVQAMPVGVGVEQVVRVGMLQICSRGKLEVMGVLVAGVALAVQEPIPILVSRGALAVQEPWGMLGAPAVGEPPVAGGVPRVAGAEPAGLMALTVNAAPAKGMACPVQRAALPRLELMAQMLQVLFLPVTIMHQTGGVVVAAVGEDEVAVVGEEALLTKAPARGSSVQDVVV